MIVINYMSVSKLGMRNEYLNGHSKLNITMIRKLNSTLVLINIIQECTCIM